MSDQPAAENSTDLLFEVDGPVATITLNRPTKLNTMTPAMGRELLEIVQRINRDDAIRAVILTATGERAFSAGSDVGALDDYGSNWELRNRVDYAKGIFAIRKPVIAKIRGYCIGGGLEMALMSDVRIADTTSKFGAGEIKLGWMGGAGNTQLLPRIVGSGRASKMLFTGDIISAAEADKIGLVDELCDPAELDRVVGDLARGMSASAPIAVQLAKHLVRMAGSTTIDVGLAYENDLFTYCFTTEDSNEGRAAFAEKRPPHFEGR